MGWSCFLSVESVSRIKRKPVIGAYLLVHLTRPLTFAF